MLPFRLLPIQLGLRVCQEIHGRAAKPRVQAESEELNRLVRIAALTVDPYGRVRPLATKAGLEYQAIVKAIRRGYFTAGQACALELAFGPELLPKEKLCPKKFAK